MSLLQGVDPDLLDGAVTVVKELNNQGHEAYFAGGAVRDLLLGNTVRDIDVATSASPQQIEELFPKTIAVGKQFGVMVVVIDSRNYEVATFRQESGYTDGRHPSEVSFTDARRDVARPYSRMSLLQGVDPDLLDGAVTVVKELNNQGHEAYFAGGAVRDLLLGNTVRDIDVATSASPQQIEELFPKTIAVGKQFGVMVVVIDSRNYEVATFRQESGYTDGRHPSEW